MQGDGEQEEADYQAECQAEGEAEAQAQEELEIEKLTNLSKAISELEGIKIDINIIKQYIHPLKNWLDKVLPKKEGEDF